MANGGADEQPTLVLRCQEGRVSAYLVMGNPSEIATGAGHVGSNATEIELDSAPPCSENAP